MSDSKRFPFTATVAFLITTAILCSLGYWQIERLKWKTKIINSIEAQEDINAHNRLLNYQDIMKAKNKSYPFLRGSIEGWFTGTDRSVFIRPRTNSNGEVGAHLVQAFELKDKKHIVIVNLGWVSQRDKDLVKTSSERPVQIAGHFKKPKKSSISNPVNQAERDIWTHLDLQDLKNHWNIENLAPLVFYVEETKQTASNGPEGFSKHWRPYNKHKQYAIFWFSMAAVLCVIFFLRFIRPWIKD